MADKIVFYVTWETKSCVRCPLRSTPVSTVLRKSVEFFINKSFSTRFRIKISQVEIWPISCLNDPENEMRYRILGLSQWPDLFFISFICEDILCTSVSSPHTKIRGKTLSPPFFFYQYSTYKWLELKRLNIENDNLALFWITGFLQSATDTGVKVYNSNYLSQIDSRHHRRTGQ